MAFEGLPEQPFIVFFSGDILVYIRDVPIVKNGILHDRIYMSPTPQVMWRYKLDSDKLDYTISEYGSIVREYPADHMHPLSRNPEYPVFLQTCNFDGTVSSFGFRLTALAEELKRRDAHIRTLEEENMKIREKLRISIERLRVLERREV